MSTTDIFPSQMTVFTDIHASLDEKTLSVEREELNHAQESLEDSVGDLLNVRNIVSVSPANRSDNSFKALNSVHARSSTLGEDIVLPWTLDGLRVAQRNDQDIECIIKLKEQTQEKPTWETIALKSTDVKTLWNLWPRLSLRNGLLKRRFESNDGVTERWQVVLPKDLRAQFLDVAHGGMTGGHMRRQKTAAAVQSRAYWPTWSTDLDNFLKQCVPCSRYHRGTLPHRAAMQTPAVGEPWERISIDITGPHPKSSRGNIYILTLVDHFSKWAEAMPLSSHTAPVVARALMTHVFSRFGLPKQLLSDRGPEFESDLFCELMKWLEIDKLRTTSYKPSTNGVVERFHRTLNSMLGKIVSDSQRNWDECLPPVMAAYRASPHDSTGFSPNKLFLGRENRMPLDLLMGFPEEELERNRSSNQFVAEIQEKTENAYAIARKQLGVAAERRKATYDIRVKVAKYSVGEWVWYYYPRRYQRRSPKWQKNYTGPFLIVRVIEPVNYVLQMSQRAKPFVVHTDKIKRCFSQTPTSWLSNDGFINTTRGAQNLPEEQIVYERSSDAVIESPERSDMLPLARRGRNKDSKQLSTKGGVTCENGEFLGQRPRKPPMHFIDYHM
jgi:transposase InsO family protein